MTLTLYRAEEFNADFDQHYRWYLDQAGEAVAANFLKAVTLTLPLLAQQPDLGRLR
jgi:plasmid stabilization system protein ParE